MKFKKITQNIAQVFSLLLKTIKQHPVELLLLIYSTCALYNPVEFSGNTDEVVKSPIWKNILCLVPIAVVLAITLRQLTHKRAASPARFPFQGHWVWHVLYYLLPVAFGLCYSIHGVETWPHNISYSIITFALLPLWLLLRYWQVRNERFLNIILHAVRALIVALMCGTVVFVLCWLIIFSLDNIFGTSLSKNNLLVLLCYVILTPMLFISIEDSPHRLRRLKGFWEILFNWVLTPALLIYTVILYVYGANILFTWSLPKGSVAIMVFVFTLVSMVAKMLQPLVTKCPLGWFYKYFSWFALPLLLLFWVGTLRRICDYGVTSSRYYLLLCGALMTFYVLLFLFRNRHGYFIVATTTFIFFLASIAIPYLSAEQVSLRSQVHIVCATAQSIGRITPQGKLLLTAPQESDTLQCRQHRKLYQSLKYIEETDSTYLFTQLGVKNSSLYLSSLSCRTRDFAEQYCFNNSDEDSLSLSTNPQKNVYLYNGNSNRSISCKGYSRVILPYIKYNGTSYIIQFAGHEINADTLLAHQLRKCDFPIGGTLSRPWLEQHQNEMLLYTDSQCCIVMSSMRIELSTAGSKITDIGIAYILLK